MIFTIFLTFAKIGLFSFGGAYGAIPLIRDVVISYGWLSEEKMMDMIAVSESTPGPHHGKPCNICRKQPGRYTRWDHCNICSGITGIFDHTDDNGAVI